MDIDNIFNTPQWLLNEEIATKLSKATLHNKVSAMQSRGLNRILPSSRLNRMTDYQNESGYSLENMILGLSEGLFNINNPDKLERNIQAQFISQLHQLTTKESKANQDVKSILLAHLNDLESTVKKLEKKYMKQFFIYSK